VGFVVLDLPVVVRELEGDEETDYDQEDHDPQHREPADLVAFDHLTIPPDSPLDKAPAVKTTPERTAFILLGQALALQALTQPTVLMK
jgi:hypothetical protein